VLAILGPGLCRHAQAAEPAQALRRVEVHVFGGDRSAGAPLAPWYREIGITDVWLYALQGAFPQDQRPETQKSVDALESEGTLAAYREEGLRYWWMERPVPDYFYATSEPDPEDSAHLWGTSAHNDALWADVCRRIREIYPKVREAGFAGVVYDNEAYYSFQGDESGQEKPWVWGGHQAECGKDGGYYARGLEVGRAIAEVWPDAKVVMAYAFGYAGERWWYQGVAEGGVDLIIGPEHTYGAGAGELGDAWYQSWWQGRTTKQTCDWKRTVFPFIRDNRHVNAGLFPIEFTTKKPNYLARHFREQLASAANDDPEGPIAVWLWPQGPFTPESWKTVEFAPGDSADAYLDALRDFSQGCSER